MMGGTEANNTSSGVNEVIHIANLLARLLLPCGVVYTVARSTDLMYQIVDTFPIPF